MRRKTILFVMTLMISMVCAMAIPTVSYGQESGKASAADTQTVETAYEHTATAHQNGVTFKIEWNEPKMGEPTIFHTSAEGGSGQYCYRMDAPTYIDPISKTFETIADPTRGRWKSYTEECNSHDFEFTATATGVYRFYMYFMDTESGVYYLRTAVSLSVSDEKYPSVSSIISSAVAKCEKETDGTDYAKALWLHDWLNSQLDYDDSLEWSSSEAALTRKLGTCQAYESAYSKLLTAAGIENAETRDEADGHTWNAMKLDGKWYQVDCTWDDTKENYYDFDSTHLYFGLTDELMALAHKGHNEIYTADGYATRSTSLEDNFYIRSGDAAKWAKTYEVRVRENLNAGKTEFEIAADNASYPESISGIQNGIIAYALSNMNWNTVNKDITLQVSGTATGFSFSAQYADVVRLVNVTFASNGGSVSKNSKVVIAGKTYGALPTPARRGYTFAGWYTAKSGGNRIISTTKVSATKSHTVYARWNIVKYKLQYKLGGGTNNRSNPSTYTVASKTITLKNPVRKGYTFKGWYSDSKFKTRVTKIAAKSVGSKTLYARWQANKYTIQFVKNGGTGRQMKSMILTYGGTYALRANTYTRKGYRFVGWATSPKGKVVYKNKQKVKNLASGDKAVRKLYARWVRRP